MKILCDLPAAPLAFDSPAARAPRLVPAFAALRQWAARTGVPGAPAGMDNSAAIKLPEWLESVSLRPATGHRVLVICASPFLLVPQEPSFSMVQTRYPSDAHLARTSAETIYGTTDKHGHLANTTVLWAYGSENIWTSQHHRERVTRWWSMFIASQGPNAVLARFTSDTPQVLLESLRTDHHPIGDFAATPSDSAVVMRVATAQDIPVEVPLPNPPPQPKPVAQPATIVLPVPAASPVAVPQPSSPPRAPLHARLQSSPAPHGSWLALDQGSGPPVRYVRATDGPHPRRLLRRPDPAHCWTHHQHRRRQPADPNKDPRPKGVVLESGLYKRPTTLSCKW